MSEGKTEREINRWIGESSSVMWLLYGTVVVKLESSLKAKLSIYKYIYVPTLTYAPTLMTFGK